ncbi:MAG: hypothetical protein B7Z60_08565 [Ferrovum sp. 37-45-19]|jgi:Smg protein|uniref:DUF494 family protein n=1 Tax=Ferrovum sp. JA12 TaxID=1356299 RepID=UPI000703739D|nr:DUF494 domain-containing protein [Ferrovum sp. JA12]OYV78804.1 MAG: hypothetical protein B7Z65_08790 [Ferrovum sp. 21-44-67]OYV93471.1 MAG: hypothetical protein B7Z60_08565 [Ferrovum sp. 37-45-19]OZB34494.1 MAG: hypothetical protein B7X47_00320 [Ferrovum sp. 34-44-207]HQT82239.1 DUF494 domain-containing protein [Ferrovaceae bacterium]KRH79401.1 protein Smg [Ferrovum sp. JA12]
MVDILIFVYENFFDSGIYPSNSTLQTRLFAAGFNEKEVNLTLDWFDHLDKLSVAAETNQELNTTIRCLHAQEQEKISASIWGFLLFLEQNNIISPSQREWVLSSIMSLDINEIDLERVKLITLMILWRQGQSSETLLLEELLHENEFLLH